MNAKIKQLAEQAGYTKDMFGVGHWDMPECQQFSRLIVRECMNICKKHPSRDLENGWFADAVAPDLVQQFEEHFGFEE